MSSGFQSMLSRRGLIAGAAAASSALLVDRAAARAPQLGTQAPAFYRFKIGTIEATVVSDGPLSLGAPRDGIFVGVGKSDLETILSDNYLPTGEVAVEQNALVINTGEQLVLIDTGMGTTKMFGPNSGRLLANLKAAGIEPASIDAVLLTHAHPDHCWGLMNGGTRFFPNAQIYLAQADFDFWTDPSKASGPMADMMKSLIAGTRGQLLPNRERLKFVRDGQEVVPGVQAMATPGHTVGHTSFMVTSGGSSLLFAGDIAHVLPVVLARPRVEFTFDTDGKQAVASRIRTFDMLAAQRVPMLTYHFPWPGVGYLARQGDGYRYHPAPMTMTL
ncbi:MAG: MBL fold metallo-hydrolase [Pseudolabrys sp.]